MSKFHLIDRDINFLLTPSVQEWLPEGYLARYVVEVLEGLDLSDMERAYAGRGSAAYHPAFRCPPQRATAASYAQGVRRHLLIC